MATTWDDAFTLEHRGEWDAARAAFHGLFWRAVKAGQMEESVNALRGAARVLHRKGSYDEAQELAELSRAIAECSHLPQAAARATNVIAAIRHSRQDWPGAERLYWEALEMGFDVGDDELIGLTCQNLGILANIQGDLREARTRYLESIGSFVRCGNERNAAITYNNLGMVCADLEEWMEAEIYFDRGIEIAERIGGFAQLLASLYANRTESLLRFGELTRVPALLDRAQEIATRIGAQSTLIDIARFRGMHARLQGNLPAADLFLDEALAIATQAQVGIGRAEVMEEMALLRREQGREQEARELLQSALELFRGMRAGRDVQRVERSLGLVAEPLPSP